MRGTAGVLAVLLHPLENLPGLNGTGNSPVIPTSPDYPFRVLFGRLPSLDGESSMDLFKEPSSSQRLMMATHGDLEPLVLIPSTETSMTFYLHTSSTDTLRSSQIGKLGFVNFPSSS